MRARFHAEPVGPGHRAAAAGAHAARRRRRPAPGRGGRRPATCASGSPAPSARAASTTPAPPTPRSAPALQRPLRGDADRGGRRLQPLARPRGHPLARGRAPATTGAPTSTCATSQSGAVLVGRLPADRRRARRATRSPSPRTAPRSVRRDGEHRDPARGRRLAGGRRRGPPGHAHQPRRAQPREIELTSYAEVVLAPPAADAAHPAFSKLFVETEFVAGVGGAARHAPAARSPDEAAALGGARRRRSTGETSAASQFETDRARFLGRGRSVRTPAAVLDGRPLSRHRRRGARPDLQPAPAASALAPGETRPRRLRHAGGAARATRRSTLADKYRDAAAFERAVDPGLDPGPGAAAPPRHRRRTRRTCSSAWPAALLYADPSLRAPPRRCSQRNRRGPAGALGARHLRRPADRAGAHRRGRRPAASSASCCARTSTGA